MEQLVRHQWFVQTLEALRQRGDKGRYCLSYLKRIIQAFGERDATLYASRHLQMLRTELPYIGLTLAS